MDRFFEIKNYLKSDDNIATKTLIFDTSLTSGVSWVVKPGQSVKCHMHPNADDIWIILKGEGLFHEEVGKDRHVKAGDIIVNRKGDCHGITNNTGEDLEFIGIISPIPAQYEALQ